MSYILKLIGIFFYYLRYKYTQYWSVEKINNYQFKRLKKQLIQASKTNYYDKLFSAYKFDPKLHFNSIDDLKKIPLTQKNEVKKNLNDFIVPYLKPISLKFFTSGSSGTPMLSLIHPIQWIVEQAVVFRHWIWGGYKFRDRTVMLRSYSPTKEEKLWKYSLILNTLYFSPFHMSEKNLWLYYKKIKKFNPKILRGYPSSIKVFVEFLKKNNLKLDKIKLVLTASEVLSDKNRKEIESVLNCKVSNHYGLAEQIVMFGNCEQCTHLHNYFEYGYVELLDTDKYNIKKVIGTNLHNLTMPLIRYDTGDLAIIDSKKCKCRRKGIQIKNIIGRDDQYIVCPNGSTMPSVNFFTMFEHYLKIDRWQISYNSKKIYFNYQSSKKLDYKELKSLNVKIRQRIDNTGFKYELKEVKKFHKKGEGKISPIIKLE